MVSVEELVLKAAALDEDLVAVRKQIVDQNFRIEKALNGGAGHLDGYHPRLSEAMYPITVSHVLAQAIVENDEPAAAD